MAGILCSQAPLADRYKAICKELEPLKRGSALLDVAAELGSMARSAADNREAPFLEVGEGLLIYYDSELCRESEARGQDTRSNADWQSPQRELEDEEGRHEITESDE